MDVVPVTNPWISPCPLSGSLLVTETSVKPAGPERESLTLTLTFRDTSLLLGGQRMFGLAVQAIVGGVLSILIPLTVAEAEFPARSVHVPVTDCPGPSAERVVGAGGLPTAKPERLSPHWKLTMTFVLFQPFALGGGVSDAVIVGGVLSSLIVIVLAVSTFPALSVPKNVIVVTPSVLMVKEVEAPATVVPAMV
jgi:hypothetical protein